MFKTKNSINSDIFNGKFQNVKHIYPTSFSKNNYFLPQTQKTFLKSEILSCSSSFWSNILPASTKSINYLPLISHLFFFLMHLLIFIYENLFLSVSTCSCLSKPIFICVHLENLFLFLIICEDLLVHFFVNFPLFFHRLN